MVYGENIFLEMLAMVLARNGPVQCTPQVSLWAWHHDSRYFYPSVHYWMGMNETKRSSFRRIGKMKFIIICTVLRRKRNSILWVRCVKMNMPWGIYGMEDNFSKFVGLYPASTLSLEFVKAFLSWVGIFGTPKYLRSDGGSSQFTSNKAQAIKAMLKYHHIVVSYHPQANSMAE